MFISLDASTTAIGWAVFNEDELIEYGRLTPSEKDLDWRERVHNLLPQLENLILKYKPTKIYQEDVPMLVRQGEVMKIRKSNAGDVTALYKLSYLQGALSIIQNVYSEVEYIEVGKWRKNIGINDGKDQRRNAKKIKSIERANELFGLDLPLEFTRGGNYKPNGSDDISDAVLLGASMLDKYKVKPKSFGKGVK